MISIVIPTYNEAEALPDLLARLRCEPEVKEIIVVDGGSQDRTVALALDGGAEVIQTAPGRGAQICRGASLARGDPLLFLHADSCFPAGGLAAIERLLADNPALGGGNFRLRFDGDSDFSRWLTGFYAWIRRHGVYYGDSGIFVRRAVYDRLGGIRPIALMEDFDLVRRLERAGPTGCIADPPLVTSSRRFEGRHPVMIFLGWLKIHALYYLGVPPARLARLYDSLRLVPGPADMRS